MAGFFRLEPAPAGRFFVHVDGRTAVGSQWRRGAYYPVVGKAWEAVVGRSNNLAENSHRSARTSPSLRAEKISKP